MAKITLFKLENGVIEYSNDGETEVYMYNGTPLADLNDQQKSEIQESQVFKDFVTYTARLMEQLRPIIIKLAEEITAALQPFIEAMQKAEAEKAKAEAAKKKKAAKKPAAKKVKKDETK